MRRTVFGILAIVLLCGSLVALTGVNATAKDEAQEEKGQVLVGGLDDDHVPLLFVDDAYCESGCCWASCSGASDCSVSCSASGCSASGGGQSASVLCEAE